MSNAWRRHWGWRIATFGMLFLTACGIAGCGPLWPKDTVRSHEDAAVVPGTATVYLYRPHVSGGSLFGPLVTIDDREVTKLKDQGYAVVHLPPGTYSIKATWPLFNREEHIVSVPDAGRYWLKFDHTYRYEPYFNYSKGIVTTTTVRKSYWRWSQVQEGQARQEISECYLIGDSQPQ